MAHDSDPHTEPSSPAWLPALGLFLLLAVGTWFATRAPADAPPGPATAAAAPAAAH